MNKILIVTSSGAPGVQRVIDCLENRNSEFVRINTDRILNDCKSSLNLTNNDLEWEIYGKSEGIKLKNISSIWYRNPLPPEPEKVPKRFESFSANETKRLLNSLWSLTPNSTLWVNPPEILNLIEGNKPYQMEIAKRCSFKIPSTVITTDSNVALEFAKNHSKGIAIKTLGRNEVKNDQGDYLYNYTKRIFYDDIKDNLENIKYSPVMLQEYVEKDVELRITIVGSKIFPCVIHSQDSPQKDAQEDWRHYDFDNVRFEKCKLPENIEKNLLKFMERLNLQFGAIDMIVTPKGDYVFLEVNASGQWGWIEEITEMPITESLVDLLNN